MREIKFRGYTGRTLGFIEDIDIGYDFSGELSKPECFDQYTGLKDKNGVEIYEGDIIIDHEHGVKDEVVFENGCFYGTFALYKCIVQDQVNVEVIGNIYENKELL